MRLENTPTTSCTPDGVAAVGSRKLCPEASKTASSSDSFLCQRRTSTPGLLTRTNSPVERLYRPGLHTRLALPRVINARRIWGNSAWYFFGEFGPRGPTQSLAVGADRLVPRAPELAAAAALARGLIGLRIGRAGIGCWRVHVRCCASSRGCPYSKLWKSV